MFRKAIIMGAFALIQKFLIDKISFEPLKAYFTAQIVPATRVADILTDSDPNNEAQMKAFWTEYQTTLKHNSIEFAISIITDKVKDPTARQVVIDILRSLDNEGNLLA